MPPVGQQLSVMTSADLEARSVSADPTLLCQDVSRSALYSQVAEPRGLPPAQLSMFPEETVPENTAKQDSEAIQRSNGVCGTPSSGEGAESLLLEESGNAEAGDLREMSQPHLSRQQGSPSHALPTEAAAFTLQKTLPMNVLSAARVSKTMPVSGPHLDQMDHCPLTGVPVLEAKLGM